MSKIIKVQKKGMVKIDGDYGILLVDHISLLDLLDEKVFVAAPETDCHDNFAGKVTISVELLSNNERQENIKDNNVVKISKIGVVDLGIDYYRDPYLTVNEVDMIGFIADKIHDFAPETCDHRRFLGRVTIIINILSDCLSE